MLFNLLEDWTGELRSFSSRTEVHQEPAPVVLCEEQVVCVVFVFSVSTFV